MPSTLLNACDHHSLQRGTETQQHSQLLPPSRFVQRQHWSPLLTDTKLYMCPQDTQDGVAPGVLLLCQAGQHLLSPGQLAVTSLDIQNSSDPLGTRPHESLPSRGHRVELEAGILGLHFSRKTVNPEVV